MLSRFCLVAKTPSFSLWANLIELMNLAFLTSMKILKLLDFTELRIRKQLERSASSLRTSSVSLILLERRHLSRKKNQNRNRMRSETSTNQMILMMIAARLQSS